MWLKITALNHNIVNFAIVITVGKQTTGLQLCEQKYLIKRLPRCQPSPQPQTETFGS